MDAARALVQRARTAAGNPEDSPENWRLILTTLVELAQAEFKADGQRLLEALRPFEPESEKSLLKGAADLIVDWKRKLGKSIRQLFLAGALALGGGETLTPEDVGDVDRAVVEQAKFLNGFAQAVQDERQGLDGSLPNRESLYAAAGWGAAWKVEAGRAMREGKLIEQWMLGTAEHHCPDCPALAEMGPVPLGTLPAISSTVCNVNCRCYIIYS